MIACDPPTPQCPSQLCLLMMCLLKVACILLAALTLNAQEDYGARGAGMARRRNNRGPLITVVLAGVCGWTVGSWLSDSSAAKKYQAKKLPLLEYIQQQEQTAQLRETQYKKQYQKLYREYERMERADSLDALNTNNSVS